MVIFYIFHDDYNNDRPITDSKNKIYNTSEYNDKYTSINDTLGIKKKLKTKRGCY